MEVESFYLDFDNTDIEFTIDDEIKGKVMLNLYREMKTRGLFLRVVGKSNVFWLENEYDGDIEHNEPFTSKELIIDKRVNLLDANDELILLESGQHEFKFCFKLRDLINSNCNVGTTETILNADEYFPFSFQHEYGEVKYFIASVLRRPINDFDYQSLQFIKIKSALNNDYHKNLYLLPYKCKSSKDYHHSFLKHASGHHAKSNTSAGGNNNSTILEVTCDKLCYMPSEIIKCSIYMKNDCSMRKFTKLKVKLIKIIEFRANKPSKQTKICKQTICSFKQANFSNSNFYSIENIMIQVPQYIDCLSTLCDTHNIQCRYEMHVRLYTTSILLPTSCKQPIEAVIPIIIYHKMLIN